MAMKEEPVKQLWWLKPFLKELDELTGDIALLEYLIERMFDTYEYAWNPEDVLELKNEKTILKDRVNKLLDEIYKTAVDRLNDVECAYRIVEEIKDHKIWWML